MPAVVPPDEPHVEVAFPADERPTRSRNRKVSLLDALVRKQAAIMDHAGEEAFTDLVEISELYGDWDDGRRRLLLALARALSGEKPFP